MNRKIAQENHPDKNTDAGTVEIFNAATAAYEVLIDPDQRIIYDDFGEQVFVDLLLFIIIINNILIFIC